jgi:tetratricopeptide (TPR) repeat protein
MIRECLNCIPHIIGRSPIEFLESQYKSELLHNRSALRSKEQKLSDSRSDIAFCLLKMGKIKQAQSEYELALRSNSMCVQALIGLAVIKLNYSESLNTLNLCVTFSKKCDIDTIKVETINKIAFGFYIQENYDKAEKYSKIVLNKSKNADRLTESYNLLGKIYEYKVSIKFYYFYYYFKYKILIHYYRVIFIKHT